MKKVSRFLWALLEIIIIIYVILMTSILLSKNKYGYTQFWDYTLFTIDLIDERGIDGSKVGDLYIVKNTNEISKDDVIYYYVVYNESYVIQNAKVLNVESDKYSAVYTIENGGSLNIASNRVLGKDVKVYHKLGKVLDVLESKLGFLFLVLLPILVIFIYQIYDLIMIFRYENVEESDKDNDKSDKDDKSKKDVKEETPAKEEKRFVFSDGEKKSK